tara:strand:- start:201 stop:770 length:570 start_codon:yes stop_codon:yes gene_type:complete
MKKFLILFLLIFPLNSYSDEKNWDLLKEGGKIAMIRHSLADQKTDGTPISGGDADGFTLDSCAKQRVLGKSGINQSIRMGEEFRKRKIKVAKVLSSVWCRCQSTAGYAFGQYEVKKFLNSTYQYPYSKNESKQLKDLKKYVENFNEKKTNLVMITHFSIITEIADSSPRQGTIVITDKKFNVLGTIQIN